MIQAVYNVGTNDLQSKHTQQKKWAYNSTKLGTLISYFKFTCLFSYSTLLVLKIR